MNDEERKAEWAKVTDPREALDIMVQNSMFIGTDPYYRDLNDALWDMAERALKASEKGIAA